jgi:hypothetical protein
MKKWWENYPWRMIQTNLREIDMLDISADSYVQKLIEFNANVVMINAAGIIASYETDTPFHYQSKFLKGDSLKAIVDLCHKNGIKVIARTDFSKVRREIYEQYPQWSYRTKEGKIVDYNGDVHVCLNGDYQQKYAFEIIKELFEKIPFDGLYCNMGGFQTRDYSYNEYGICHCNSCRKKFYEMFGLELPNSEDMKNPIYRKYKVFQEKCLSEHKDRFVSFMHSIDPNIAIDDGAFARIEASTEYKRRLPHWPYNSSCNARVVRGDGSRSVFASNTSVDYIGYFYRHVAVSPALQEMRLWQNLANLGSLDYYVIGRLDNHLDRSGFERIKKVFSFHKSHEYLFLNLKAKADVAIIRTHRWALTTEEKGWIRVLTESHVLFDEILLDEFMDMDTDKYKVVVLPDIKYISEQQAVKLDKFVKKGGKVIAVGETGLYDENYEFRSEQALKSLGIQKVNYIKNDMVSSMLLVEAKDKETFISFEDTDVIAIGDTFIYTNTKEGVDKYFKLIPPHSFGPPERCYFNDITDIPGVVRNKFGDGGGIYIPWMPGTFFNGGGHSNSYNFMKDVIISMCGVHSVAEELTPMVEVTVSSHENTNLVVQLVNNSGHFAMSFYEPIPVHDIRLEIPSEREPKEVRSIKTQSLCKYSFDNHKIKIELDKLKEYDALVINYV